MTVTAASPFRCGTEISEDAFVDELRRVGSFGTVLWNGVDPEAAARQIYGLIVDAGHSAEVWLLIAAKEHTYGTNRDSVLWRNDTRSWTNARSVRAPSLKQTAVYITDSQRSGWYVKYATVVDSIHDGLFRVDEPGYAYAGKVTIAEVIAVWAPGDDGNNPTGYAATVADGVNDLRARYPREEPPMADIPGVPFIAADSRHFTRGRTVTWPDLLVQHHTDGFDSLAWLTTSPNSNVSATYLLHNDGTIRAQLVRHADTPHTTGSAINPRSISCEWERYWTDPARRQMANGVQDSVYRNIGAFWARVILAERERGNPHFQGVPTRQQMGAHKDYANTTCPGNLDVSRVYQEAVTALQAEQPGGGGGGQTWPYVPRATPDPWRDHLGGNPFDRNLWIPNMFLVNIAEQGGFDSVGFACSEGFVETNEDGVVLFVQYFERAKLELHESGMVTRARLGYQEMVRRYPERRAA